MLEADTERECDGRAGVVMLIGELTLEAATPPLKMEKFVVVEVAEMGDRRLLYSGGTVVLLWYGGLA